VWSVKIKFSDLKVGDDFKFADTDASEENHVIAIDTASKLLSKLSYMATRELRKAVEFQKSLINELVVVYVDEHSCYNWIRYSDQFRCFLLNQRPVPARKDNIKQGSLVSFTTEPKNMADAYYVSNLGRLSDNIVYIQPMDSKSTYLAQYVDLDKLSIITQKCFSDNINSIKIEASITLPEDLPWYMDEKDQSSLARALRAKAKSK